MALNKILNTIVKVFLPLLLGILLLWFLYRDMDFGEILEVIQKGVRYDIIFVSLLFGLAANIIRGYRWGLLIGTLGERFKMRNLIYAVLGNYAINFVLPRVGEVWRCGIITKYEKISFPKLIGTLLIDRLADTVSVGLLALFVFTFHFGFFKHFLARNPELMHAFSSDTHALWIGGIFLILAAAVWFTFTRLNHFSLVQKAKGLLSNVWEGMKSIARMKHKGLFMLQTLLIWTFYFFFFYITFYAFDFTRSLGANAGLIAFTMSSIGVAVPIQGGIGPWHFMVIASLMCFGVRDTDAAAFALVVHSVQSIWTALCGLFGIIALPIGNSKASPR
ncbi:MAG: flippase-like domain-containing protein [Tannerellaceae bacterium]|jgi:uncharacterized protein (TIRG00374 family)|nr:flippase-like domain-containing protein [Tannerellaceae bacterium]